MEDGNSNSYRHILKYTSIFGGVQGLNVLTALVRNKCAALFLGPAGMGFASLMTATTNFLTQTAGLGLSFSAVRHISEYFDEGKQERILHCVGVIRIWCLLAAFLGIILCTLSRDGCHERSPPTPFFGHRTGHNSHRQCCHQCSFVLEIRTGSHYTRHQPGGRRLYVTCHLYCLSAISVSFVFFFLCHERRNGNVTLGGSLYVGSDGRKWFGTVDTQLAGKRNGKAGIRHDAASPKSCYYGLSLHC